MQLKFIPKIFQKLCIKLSVKGQGGYVLYTEYKFLLFLPLHQYVQFTYRVNSAYIYIPYFLIYTTKNILGIAHPKHSILLMVGRFLEGNLGYFALLVASNQIYFL